MKALFGAATDPQTLRLLDEIRALRSRVDELEDALAEAERARAEVAVEVDVRAVEAEVPAGV